MLETPEGVSHQISIPVILTWAVPPAEPASHHLQTSPWASGCPEPDSRVLPFPSVPAILTCVLPPPGWSPRPCFFSPLQFIFYTFQSNLLHVHTPLPLPFSENHRPEFHPAPGSPPPHLPRKETRFDVSGTSAFHSAFTSLTPINNCFQTAAVSICSPDSPRRCLHFLKLRVRESRRGCGIC